MNRWHFFSAMGIFIFLHGAAFGADMDRFRIDLGGEWQAQAIQAARWEEAVAPPAAGGWINVTLPAPGWPKDAPKEFQSAPGVWLRRSFRVSHEQAGLGAVLHWELIRWGFAATVNGKPLGETILYAPGEMALSKGMLKAGENEIELKVRNWDALPRGGEWKHPLAPCGSALFGWGSKSSMVSGAIELVLFDSMRISQVLMVTDLINKKAIAHLELTRGSEAAPSVQVAVRVLDAAGVELGAATVRPALPANSTQPLACQVEVPLNRVPAWTPGNPQMVHAEITLTSADDAARTLDTKRIPFGLRTFEVRGGHFLLNGEPYPLRGSNLVNDWLWTEERFRNVNNSLKTYLVDTARGMSCNSFRTHTMPPTHTVAEVCDANGMLLLAEMPLTYNGSPTGLDDEQERQYRENARQMIVAWVRELANHPSVVIWVPVNEPPMGEKRDLYGWTHNVVYPAIKAADPTRPILFAAEESPDIQDIHCYAGYWDGAEGQFYQFVERRAATRDPQRALMNTEYIEGLPPERAFRWTGQTERTPEANLVYAMFGMEQTEAMRRLNYDGILPYMFSGWARGSWRPGYPTPMYAALGSALAPVAVSVDLFDRNYPAGAAFSADIWAINDGNVPAQAEMCVYLCRKNPEFVPETVAQAEAQLIKKIPLTLKAGTRHVAKVDVVLPDGEARLYLAAVLAPQQGKTVMSQREFRVLAPTVTPDLVARRKYRVIGADAEALAWLQSRRIRFETGIPFTKMEPDVDMVVVWQDAEIDAQTATMAGWISDYVLQGGRLLMLRRQRWTRSSSPWWQFPRWENGEPFEYDTRADTVSSAFVAPGAKDSPLFAGIQKDYLLRWNGQLGAISNESIIAGFLKGTVPAAFDGAGYRPTRQGTVVMEGKSARNTNFVTDEFDERFVERREGKLVPVAFQAVRGNGRLLLTKTKPPDAYTATYEFETQTALNGELWIYEHGRNGSSPFAWRVDDQPYQTVGSDAPKVEPRRVHDKKSVWFDWTNGGPVRLEPGPHRLDIRVTQPATNGVFMLNQDLFLIAPRATGETLLISGSRLPIMVRTETGKGSVLITQTLFKGRLLKETPHYDPAAERLLLNLLGF